MTANLFHQIVKESGNHQNQDMNGMEVIGQCGSLVRGIRKTCTLFRQTPKANGSQRVVKVGFGMVELV